MKQFFYGGVRAEFKPDGKLRLFAKKAGPRTQRYELVELSGKAAEKLAEFIAIAQQKP